MPSVIEANKQESQPNMIFRCEFTAELWNYGGESSWWFVRLPVEDAEDIERFCSHRKRNFGSIRVTATIGKTSWQTSIFRDTKSNSYLLPVKAKVRSKEDLSEGQLYEVSIAIGEPNPGASTNSIDKLFRKSADSNQGEDTK